MERFLQLFARFVDFTYAIWDRIVLRGYYGALQRPENIVYFFREVCGVRCITPAVLAGRTEQYRKWVEGYASRRAIPILIAPKGTKKEHFVAPYYQKFRKEGVVVILKSMEQAPTFISYEPRFPPPSGKDYRIIKRASGKQYLHYYFYVLDPVVGPMSLRVGSYLPFTLGCFMNGHSYLACQLEKRGIRFRKEDNAILDCDDAKMLQRLANSLDVRVLSDRANYWAWRLSPSFSRRERQLSNLQHYLWSIAQIEFSQNIIFNRSTPGLAERIDKTRRYRLTTTGVRTGVLLVKARTRLLGPILTKSAPNSQRSANPSKVEAALRGVDKALDTLCDQLGLRLAA